MYFLLFQAHLKAFRLCHLHFPGLDKILGSSVSIQLCLLGSGCPLSIIWFCTLWVTYVRQHLCRCCQGYCSSVALTLSKKVSHLQWKNLHYRAVTGGRTIFLACVILATFGENLLDIFFPYFSAFFPLYHLLTGCYLYHLRIFSSHNLGLCMCVCVWCCYSKFKRWPL